MTTSSNGNIFTLLALCAGNSLVTGEFSSQRPVTQSFGVFFDLRLNKRLSKQSRRRWFEMPLRSLWRHGNGNIENLRSIPTYYVHKGPTGSKQVSITSVKGFAPNRDEAMTWSNYGTVHWRIYESLWQYLHGSTPVSVIVKKSTSFLENMTSK